MGPLKAAFFGLALSALAGCNPKAQEADGVTAACREIIDKAVTGVGKACDTRVAQTADRARQAYERSLSPEPVPVIEIPSLGVALPGSPWNAVRDFKHSDNCVTETDQVDCLVTDKNGIEYLVFETSVATVTARAASVFPQVKLPFGLAFGDSVRNATGKLAEAENRMSWLIGKASGDEVVVSSAEEFKGADGYGFTLILKFRQNRLAELSYFRHVT